MPMTFHDLVQWHDIVVPVCIISSWLLASLQDAHEAGERAPVVERVAAAAAPPVLAVVLTNRVAWRQAVSIHIVA
eukprot:SAG22_NODE_5111_length_1083_cov_1.948171_1_plen_75_part_00